MKNKFRFLALLLVAALLITSIPAAFAEELQLDDLTAADYYAMRAAAEGNFADDWYWNPKIKGQIDASESLDDVNQVLTDSNENWIYKNIAGKSVDKNFYPVISDEDRAAVDKKIADLYAEDVKSSTTLKEAYEAQNQRSSIADLLGNDAQANIETQITEEQKTAIDKQLNTLVERFVQELTGVTSLEQFAQMLEFMTDEQKLDFLNRLTEEQYELLKDFIDNYLWPEQEFTTAEERSFTQGLLVNGKLISGDSLRDYLFGLTGRDFKVAVNQMDIKQAGSLEARVSDSQATDIVNAMCHGGFYVGDIYGASTESGSPAKVRASNFVLRAGSSDPSDPVWPNEGSIKLDKDAAAVGVDGEENLWEVTLGIQGKNFKTTSDVVLVIDCSGSMEGTKLKNTRTAAKAFGEQLLKAGSTTRIAIVTFTDEATAYKSGHFYTAGELKLFQDAVDDATYANGGTNQQAGIHAAQQLLRSADSTGAQKNIVILSDGEPTFSHPFKGGREATIDCGWSLFGHHFGNEITVSAWPQNAVPDYDTVIGAGNDFSLSDGNIIWNCTCRHNRTTNKEYGSFYYDGSGKFVCSNGEMASNNGVATIWEANQAKAAGTTIYSIALQAGTNGENTLKACASDSTSGYFSIGQNDNNDNIETKLKAAFEKIAGSIAIAASNGTVADTMGEKVQLSFSGTAPVVTTVESVYKEGHADVYISQGSATYDATNRQINWTVGNVREGDNPIMKYKVTIRQGYNPSTGETLLTNKGATFSYKNYSDKKTEKEFPKPEVTVGGGKILVHYYRVNENGKPINEQGVAVESPSLAQQVKEAAYFAVNGNTGLSYNTPYPVGYADVAGYTYFGKYILNGGDLTEGDSVNVTLTAANSNQHVWFAYVEKPKTGDLKITKTGLNQHTYTGDVDQESAIFKVENADKTESWIVAINGNSSVTLTGLKVGSYTVTELNNWTWRYADQTAQTKTVVGGGTVTVTFDNTHNNQKWLGGDNYENNKFGSGN